MSKYSAGEELTADYLNSPASAYWYGTRVYFTSSGSFAKASYSGMRGVLVRCIGAGGGGGGASTTSGSQASVGAGGGGGGYAEEWIAVGSLSTTHTVTVGTGGAGGAAGANDGDAGDDSSFGSLVVATGGGGGEGDAAGTSEVTTQGGVGGGGSGSVGDRIVRGCEGGAGVRISGPFVVCPGVGASSALGWGPGGRPSASNVGGTGIAPTTPGYGGGGSGGYLQPSQSAVAGGDGANGLVIVDVYY